jgi:UDP-glucose 4-epimerase
MAAALGVDNILENPIESISTNFYGSEVVLNAALKYDKRILIASTSEIYGKNTKQPLSETDDRVIGAPQKFRWSYSDSKALEEAIAYYLHVSKNLKVTTIRLFNTVGPRQTGDYGMVIPKFIRSALNQEPVVIYGDGTQSRVFCHVLDVVQAILALADKALPQGEVYNIGGLEEYSINELARIIIEKTKSKSQIVHKSYNEAFPFGYEDMQRRVPAITKIKNVTGWSPKKNLNSIIEDIIDHLL